MLTGNATEDSLLSFWPRVREFAVPPSMIETATARRSAGDWAGACAAAGVDVDLSLRAVARTHGQELSARLRADLRQLVPDLLRWHLPRIAPHGLLRPGLTLALARYDSGGPDGAHPVHLVVRTPPAWADAGQRISLALWDGSRSEAFTRRHPHPHPNRRFRLDLHRHLWDARRTDELRVRSGADRPPEIRSDLAELVPPRRGCAVDRWAAEAELLLRDEGRAEGTVAVRFGGRHRLFLDLVRDPDGSGTPRLRASSATDGDVPTPPVLPDAATWVLPDLELLRRGGSGGRSRRSIRRSRGGSCWAPPYARRPRAPVRARTTATAVRRGARPGCPASSSRACGADRPGSRWSSTPPARSVTPSWAARSWRSPRSPAPWVAAVT